MIIIEVLPLIEFALEDDIDDDEACQLIASSPMKPPSTDSWNDGNTQSLRMDEQEEEDPFTARLLTFEVYLVKH